MKWGVTIFFILDFTKHWHVLGKVLSKCFICVHPCILVSFDRRFSACRENSFYRRKQQRREQWYQEALGGQHEWCSRYTPLLTPFTQFWNVSNHLRLQIIQFPLQISRIINIHWHVPTVGDSILCKSYFFLS